MRNRLPRLMLFTLYLFGSLAQAQSTDSEQKLHDLAEHYYQQNALLDPLQATMDGDLRYKDRLAITISPQHRQHKLAHLQDVQTRLAAIDPHQLNEDSRNSYALLQAELTAELTLAPFPDHLLPISQEGALPVLLASLASGQSTQPLQTPEDYQALLKRLSYLPDCLSQARANMVEGVRNGIVQPKALIHAVLPQLQKLANSSLHQHPYYVPMRRVPASFTVEQAAHFKRAFSQLISQQLRPALLDFARFVQFEYLPRCRDSAGLHGLPNGQAWYQATITQHTTLAQDAESIHQLGLQEVARIHTQMGPVLSRLGFQGKMHELGKWTDRQARFTPFKSEKAILDRYRELDRQVSSKLDQLFKSRPSQPLTIQPEPALSRATASDHYTGPALDGSSPGTFWAVIQDPKTYSNLQMVSLYLHEAQPGHHFHIARQQTLDIPKFRSLGWITAYGEGWALYAETLGHELGLYQDDAALLGHLQMELLRAVRLVVDTGLHAKGWPRERSIAYMQQVQGISHREAKTATERYMAMPAQALAYKIGALKIQALRQKAAAQLGPQFKLAEFHEQILNQGALTMNLLEAKIERWLAGQRNS